jgi:hypothetical protein
MRVSDPRRMEVPSSSFEDDLEEQDLSSRHARGKIRGFEGVGPWGGN